MPTYIYINPKTGQTKEVVQTMREEHSYSEKGVKWNRLYSVPQASVDANIDPFSQQQFIEKTGKKGATFGEVYDRSEELSHKRAEKRDGTDPVKQQYYKDYSAKRRGKKHPRQIKEAIDKIHIRI